VGKLPILGTVLLPVPVDMRALKALKRSPLALDLYAWLSYEAYRAHRNAKPRFVGWDKLHEQFGDETIGFLNPYLSTYYIISGDETVGILGDETVGLPLIEDSFITYS
jgi:Plasmid encoded RepA protein